MDIKKHFIWLLAIAFGCQSVREDTGINLVISKPNQIEVNQTTIVKVFSSDSHWSLLKAYFDCESLSRELRIDSVENSIMGCEKELFVDQDTVIIQFEPDKVGRNKFHNIKVLLRSEEDNYVVKDTSFYYVVESASSVTKL